MRDRASRQLIPQCYSAPGRIDGSRDNSASIAKGVIAHACAPAQAGRAKFGTKPELVSRECGIAGLGLQQTLGCALDH